MLPRWWPFLAPGLFPSLLSFLVRLLRLRCIGWLWSVGGRGCRCDRRRPGGRQRKGWGQGRRERDRERVSRCGGVCPGGSRRWRGLGIRGSWRNGLDARVGSEQDNNQEEELIQLLD